MYLQGPVAVSNSRLEVHENSADCVVMRPALTVFNINGCFDRTASEGRKPCKRKVGSRNQDQVMQVQH